MISNCWHNFFLFQVFIKICFCLYFIFEKRKNTIDLGTKLEKKEIAKNRFNTMCASISLNFLFLPNNNNDEKNDTHKISKIQQICIRSQKQLKMIDNFDIFCFHIELISIWLWISLLSFCIKVTRTMSMFYLDFFISFMFRTSFSMYRQSENFAFVFRNRLRLLNYALWTKFKWIIEK